MRSLRSPYNPPWTSGRVSERAWCQLCPNPSPMTLEGTNTWVLTEPGSGRSIVVDPGPLNEGHLEAVLHHVENIGSRVALTLLTHHHDDHAESAMRFAELSGAPVQAVGDGRDDLADGDQVSVGGLDLLVVATPGHTADSTSFLLAREQRLLTGDTILGRGSTVVAHPDGELAAYLESLRRLEAMTGSGLVTSLAPGHGPTVADAAEMVRSYRDHRMQRLIDVQDVVRTVPTESPDEIVDAVVQEVYADVPRDLWPAARLSVLAQLEYLGAHSSERDA